jgi:hypothetical protein
MFNYQKIITTLSRRITMAKIDISKYLQGQVAQDPRAQELFYSALAKGLIGIYGSGVWTSPDCAGDTGSTNSFQVKTEQTQETLLTVNAAGHFVLAPREHVGNVEIIAAEIGRNLPQMIRQNQEELKAAASQPLRSIRSTGDSC